MCSTIAELKFYIKPVKDSISAFRIMSLLQKPGVLLRNAEQSRQV